jgi:hypothetical protein
LFFEGLVVLFQMRIAQLMDALRVHQAQLVLEGQQLQEIVFLSFLRRSLFAP